MFGKIIRYVGGAAVAWVVSTGQGAVAYFALLPYALTSGADIGGPLAALFLVLVAAALGTILIPVFYVPTLVVVEAAQKSAGLLVRLLLAASVLMTITGVLAGLLAAFEGASPVVAFAAWLVGVASLFLPAAAAGTVVYGCRWWLVFGRGRGRTSGTCPTDKCQQLLVSTKVGEAR